MDDENKEEIYVIPHNFTDGGGVFRGIFRLRNVIEGFAMALAIGYPIYKLLPTPIYAKFIIIPILSGGLMIFGCAGINDEPVSINMMYMFKFLFSRRKLVFRRVRSDGTVQNGSRNPDKSRKGAEAARKTGKRSQNKKRC